MEDQVAKAKARKKPVKDAVNLSYNSNTRKYSLRGQAGSKLIDDLVENGIQMSKDELKKKIEEYGPKLFPQ